MPVAEPAKHARGAGSRRARASSSPRSGRRRLSPLAGDSQSSHHLPLLGGRTGIAALHRATQCADPHPTTRAARHCVWAYSLAATARDSLDERVQLARHVPTPSVDLLSRLREALVFLPICGSSASATRATTPFPDSAGRKTAPEAGRATGS